MRDYGKVSPQFWIGKTGKALRKKGAEAVVVGLYLMTAPNANMLGLYYLDMPTIAHQTGLGMEGASKGLQGCIEAGFCAYDYDAEVVWVYEMAAYQIAAQLKPDDKRCIGVQNEYNEVPENVYLRAFYEKYVQAFHMISMRTDGSPTEAPSKPLSSQEQEQEQEQEQKQEKTQPRCTTPSVAAQNNPGEGTKSEKAAAGTGKVWAAYAQAYFDSYGVAPVRNAKVNGQLSELVKRLGAEEAPRVAAFYLTHKNRFYVEKMHPVGLLLADCEKLRTEWATRRQMTSAAAAQADKTQTNLSAFQPLIEAAMAEEARKREGDYVQG